jgi:hypothetical protein
MNMYVEPFWDNFYTSLDYTTETFRDQATIATWYAAGHLPEKTTIDWYPMLDDNDFSQKIKDLLPNLNHISICFHRLVPGNYLPMHSDKYGFYSKKYNVTDLNDIKRYIIFLDDCSSGHMLVVKDTVYSNWKKGDIVGWQGTDLHSAINLGMTNRYTLTVTGISNDRR